MLLPIHRFAATIGFFDGVHRGHQFLLKQLREEAGARGLKSMAVTFDRHPRQVVQTDWQPQLLTTLEEKKELLSKTGIDQVVVLPFDKAMAGFTAREFMSDVLHDRLHVEMLLTGYDNRFGHNRTETFTDYERYGRELGMEVVCARPLTMMQAGQGTREDGAAGRAYSSSIVRRLLAEGDVSRAADCLGRYYSISGQVVHGEQNGHTLGFPTANLMADDPMKLIPANGAYAVWATLPGIGGTRHGGMTNIGKRPTFHGEQLTLETNIFDTMGDLYGQPLRIEFVARLRDEKLFPSPEALARQLSLDREQAKQILKSVQTNTNI